MFFFSLNCFILRTNLIEPRNKVRFSVQRVWFRVESLEKFIENVETIAEIDHLQSVPCFINASAILEQVANLHASLEKFKMTEAFNSSRSRKILLEEKIIVSVTCHLTFNLLYLA